MWLDRGKILRQFCHAFSYFLMFRSENRHVFLRPGERSLCPRAPGQNGKDTVLLWTWSLLGRRNDSWSLSRQGLRWAGAARLRTDGAEKIRDNAVLCSSPWSQVIFVLLLSSVRPACFCEGEGGIVYLGSVLIIPSLFISEKFLRPDDDLSLCLYF